MAAKPTGKVMGRGLDALLGNVKPVTEKVANRNGVSEIELSKIVPSKKQTRKSFNEEALQELADSIKSVGIVTPIKVIRIAPETYELVYGERRLRAAQKLGFEKIPAIVVEQSEIDDYKQLVMGVIENLQREGLDPIEIAQSYQRLIEEGKLTQEELGKKVGKNHATIANSLRLLKLSPEIQAALINGDISEGHAKVLLQLTDEKKRQEAFSEILSQGLSVRATEDLVRKMKEDKKSSPTKTKKTEQQKTIQTTIANKLNAKVALSITPKGSGKISISFKNADELNAIVDLLEKIK